MTMTIELPEDLARLVCERVYGLDAAGLGVLRATTASSASAEIDRLLALCGAQQSVVGQ